jgi:hypothetical protein
MLVCGEDGSSISEAANHAPQLAIAGKIEFPCRKAFCFSLR